MLQSVKAEPPYAPIDIDHPTAGRSPGTAARLGIMMFLEFVVFGAWFATLGLVLATHGLARYIAGAFLVSAVAAIVSPLFLGALGDRFMASQKVMALAHLVGGAILLAMPGAVAAGHGATVLLLTFAYMLAFMPTLGLVNSIALRHLQGQQHVFPYVRVFGPLGWVAAGIGVGLAGLSASTATFTVAGIASLVFAAYALTLPATPPPAAGARFAAGDLVGAKALVMFRRRDFAVLMVCALLTSISLGVYNAFVSPYLGALGIRNVAGTLALGQVSEVVFIVTIPAVLARIGMKAALLLGMGMWGVRFVLFALAPQHPALAIAAVALHGICNDFFVVIAAMYIDRITPLRLAAQAQSWLILVISGFGAAVGSLLAGAVFAGSVLPRQATLGAAAWMPMWLVPIAAALLTAIIWLALFRPAPETDRIDAVRTATPA